MTYENFLQTKIEIAPVSGFDVSDDEINPVLKPHQRDGVKWAIKGGRRALFYAFGLGKTVMQLEFCRLVVKHKGGKALIVMPLGVKQEFTHDAEQLLRILAPVYVRNMEEVRAADADILCTNYERVRDGDVDPTYFTATSLDEAAVLRSFGSKTYQTFLDKFKGVPYKLVNTATPSPNRYKELIHYAGYLEVMDTGQALTRFFKRDTTKANNLTLYPHMEKEFWLWLSSFALFVSKPSDLGYSDEGYDLPKLKVNYHGIDKGPSIRQEKDGQIKMTVDASVSLKTAAKIKNESIDVRVEKMKELVNASPGEHFIIWHDLEAERHAIKKALPEAVEIYGSLDLDVREKRVIDFAEGRSRLLATKKEISGSGCNFQKHCHRAIFLGIDYEFNDFIQAIHRIYRFLQTEEVIIDVIQFARNQQFIQHTVRHDRTGIRNFRNSRPEFGEKFIPVSIDLGRLFPGPPLDRFFAEICRYFPANSQIRNKILHPDRTIGLDFGQRIAGNFNNISGRRINKRCPYRRKSDPALFMGKDNPLIDITDIDRTRFIGKNCQTYGFTRASAERSTQCRPDIPRFPVDLICGIRYDFIPVNRTPIRQFGLPIKFCVPGGRRTECIARVQHFRSKFTVICRVLRKNSATPLIGHLNQIRSERMCPLAIILTGGTAVEKSNISREICYLELFVPNAVIPGSFAVVQFAVIVAHHTAEITAPDPVTPPDHFMHDFCRRAGPSICSPDTHSIISRKKGNSDFQKFPVHYKKIINLSS